MIREPDARRGHAQLPIGAVRVHKDGKHFIRRIKVRNDGPAAYRWKDYARHWWETNRGPVPEGKRVCHADGDRLNDDPKNYVLLTPGDVVFLAHDRDPRMSMRNYKKLRAATREHNHFRAMARRMREWLPSRWYAVDLGRRIIHNSPCKKRWHVYRNAGLIKEAAASLRMVSAAVGWPALANLEALILAVLAEVGMELSSPQLLSRLQLLRSRYGLDEIQCPHSITSAMTGLRRNGFMFARRRGRLGSMYRISRLGLESRFPQWPIIAIRGDELCGEEFAGFTRINPEADAA